MSSARRDSSHKRISAALLIVSFLTSACGAGWRRTDLQEGALKPRQAVQVWRAGKGTNWHAVLIRADTVYAVPLIRPVSCDSCRVSMPRAEIDSMRLGNPVAGFWKTVGLVVAIPVAIWIGACIQTSWPDCAPTGGS